MKYLFTFIFIQLVCLLHAQVVVKPQAIVSAGKSFQKTNSGITFTVGEIVVKPMANNEVVLSNGIIASAVPFLVSKIVTNQTNIHFQLFPNPANTLATFKMESTIDEPILIKVNDLQGRKIIAQNLPHSFNVYSFAVQEWTAGMYILNVYNQKGEALGFVKFQKL